MGKTPARVDSNKLVVDIRGAYSFNFLETERCAVKGGNRQQRWSSSYGSNVATVTLGLESPFPIIPELLLTQTFGVLLEITMTSDLIGIEH